MFSYLRRRFIRRHQKTRSPLQEKDVASLRYPGQSVQTMIDEMQIDWDADLVAILLISVPTFLAWFHYFRPIDSFLQVIIYSIMAFATWVVFIPSLLLRLRNIRRLRDARNGERIVAEHLNQLIANGYTVLHDIPCHEVKKGKRKVLFNIDHLLIGPAGIFAIETKTMRKRQGRNDKLVFDGEQVCYAGSNVPLKYNPVPQARRQAGWLERELASLSKAIDKDLKVSPVVTFPGWFVTSSVRMDSVRIFGTPTIKAMRSFLSYQQELLSPGDIALVEERIKLQIQTRPL